uniref:Rho-GAP domain-containing protein n=1 Tax=Heterorhabditis bacteriophora TaxID=37862 RepID=A0A1I7XEC1_HETBA
MKAEDKESDNRSSAPPTPSDPKKMSTAKQEKAIMHDFEVHVKEIRAQLTEQIKCIGDRTETQIAVLQEVDDFFRRRGEAEAEYSRQLEKLAKGIMQRHKTEKSRYINYPHFKNFCYFCTFHKNTFFQNTFVQVFRTYCNLGCMYFLTRSFKILFKGEDAFADLSDGSESNSVAGLLKLYLRELREPLFPIFLFDQFTDCAKADSPQEFVRKVLMIINYNYLYLIYVLTSELITKLPLSHILLLRFLFSFLSHLCEFADENMMEPHNMAICFGPTLLPIPEGKDQVFYHNFVNELVRNLILHVNEVFPHDLPGPNYNKYAIADEPDQMGYMDEGDGLSEDEECLRNGILVDQAMLSSTYDMSTTTEIGRDMTSSTLQRGNTPDEPSQPPTIFEEKKFRQTPIWEQERPSSHVSSAPSYASYSSVQSTSQSNASTNQVLFPPGGVRLPVMTSLRDQLHHFRKELNGREDSKVYPMLVLVRLFSKLYKKLD